MKRKRLYNVTIDLNYVVGCGPLMSKQPSDQVSAMLYRRQCFYFELYTRGYIITVSTDWLSFLDEADKEKSTVEYEKLKAAYDVLLTHLEGGPDLDDPDLFTTKE